MFSCLFIIIWWLVTQVVWYSSMCIGVSLNGGCKLVVEQAGGEKKRGSFTPRLDAFSSPPPPCPYFPPPAGWMDGKRRAFCEAGGFPLSRENHVTLWGLFYRS